MGSVSYQHIFSSDTIGWLRGMARDNSNDSYSNPSSSPINVTQHNDFKEIYFNASVAVHHGGQKWKAGVESDAIFLHENFSDYIPDCAGPLGTLALNARSSWDYSTRAARPRSPLPTTARTLSSRLTFRI
jgi:hypothetical protein